MTPMSTTDAAMFFAVFTISAGILSRRCLSTMATARKLRNTKLKVNSEMQKVNQPTPGGIAPGRKTQGKKQVRKVHTKPSMSPVTLGLSIEATVLRGLLKNLCCAEKGREGGKRESLVYVNGE